jgi:HK97 family phage major capsid protein
MDPALKRLKDDYEAATAKASQAWSAYSKIREGLKSKMEAGDLDLNDPKALEPLEDPSKIYYEARRKAEMAKADYLGALVADHEGRPGSYMKRQGDPNEFGGDKADRWLAGQFKALVEGSGSGSFIAPPEYAATAWDRLAPKSALLRSGVTVIPTERKEFHLPRVTADVPADWVAEAGTITAGDPTVSEVVFTPRKLAALTQSSHELLVDSSPEAAGLIQANMLRALALKFDLGAFEGTGTAPQIRGLKNQPGIQAVSMGTNGATPTNLDPFADALGLLATANADDGPLAIVMHPRTWQTLVKIKEISGSAKPILLGPEAPTKAADRSIYGAPVYLTSQLSITETQGTANNASSAYVYAPREVVVVRREEFRFEADNSRLFNSDQWELRAIARADLGLPNPTAVVRIGGILP